MLLGEKRLSDPGIAGLIEILEEVEKCRYIRQLRPFKVRSGYLELLHPLAHCGRGVPHAGGDFIEPALHHLAAQPGSAPATPPRPRPSRISQIEMIGKSFVNTA